MIEHRPSWDELYMNMCYEVAAKSPDTSTHSGSYIVKQDNTPISFGYNGLPRGLEPTPERTEIRPDKYFYTEHSERNAIYNAGRTGVPLLGSRLYVNWTPCSDCARAIIQSGIIEIIIHKQGMDAFAMSRTDTQWNESQRAGLDMLRAANVTIRWFDGNIRMGLTGMWSGKRYTFLGTPQEPREIQDGAELVWKFPFPPLPKSSLSLLLNDD